MFKVRILAMAVMAALLLLFPAVALGQQVPPHISAISATVDGEAAADGTEITAWIDGEQVASATVEDGVAVLVISGDASFAGKTISFLIGGTSAAETDTWEQGGHQNAELSISTAAGATLEVALFELDQSGQSGFATLSEIGDKTNVSLWLNQGALKTEKVHIHSGQCGDKLGGVDYPLTSFVGGSGMSTTTVDATLAMLQDGNHAINLHIAGNPKNYTACGSIPKAGEAQVNTAFMAMLAMLEMKPGGSTPGSAGASGSVGAKGDKGDSGAAGSTGPAGSAGSAGADGSAGAAGPAGPAGSAGAAGEGGGGGALGIISLILAIVAILGVGGTFIMGRRTSE